MKNYIEINTGYNEYHNTLYRSRAYIVDHVPEVGDIIDSWEIVSVYPLYLDPQQPRDEVYEYTYYTCEVKDPHDDEFEHETRYYAVENEYAEEPEEEFDECEEEEES